MKIIINTCFGGFRLSEKALMWLHKNKGWKITDYNKNGHGYKDKSAKLANAQIGEYLAQGKIEHLEWVLQKSERGTE